MNKIKTSIALLATIILVAGCALTSKRITYNTLSSVQEVTTGAYNSYLDLVVKGTITTNMVPTVSKDYNMFQIVWSAAVAVAQFNTNAIATSTVTDASAKVINDISTAKGK